ncbi:M23 family metallopeptidase [Pontibacter akesuensis]|nr:M23 family metallopeptidase [Pontibacter akesuensis]
MLKLCLISLLLCCAWQALGQFNTVRKVKRLPSVEVIPPPEQGFRSDIADLAVPDSTSQAKLVLTLSMPLQRPVTNSPYGQRADPLSGKIAMHWGVDFRADRDTVLAIMPGRVKEIGYSRGLGNYIEVEHGAYSSVYGHLSLILVRESAVVPAGAALAITGSTGRSTGEHLHFTLKHRGRTVNPTPYLNAIYRRIEGGRLSNQP